MIGGEVRRVGGTGVAPVKSGVAPDFARTEAVRIFPGSSRDDRLTISGATPEITGWKPVPPGFPRTVR
jgi:hypothetical protein